MSEQPQRHPVAMKDVVYRIPGMESVVVRRDELYGPAGTPPHTMDIYYPPNAGPGVLPPVIVVVLGYRPKTPNPLGCAFKEMAWSIGWGQLIAASGIAAIVYANRDPEADAHAVLAHVRRNAGSLGIDGTRVGLFATSGSAPLALSLLMQERERLRCGVLLCPMTIDLAGATGIAEAAAQWGFVTVAEGRTVGDLPRNVPLFIARAGRDAFPGVNDAMDRFLAESLRCNLPLTFVNHTEAPHAFDLFLDSEGTREIIRQALRFMQFQLSAQPSALRLSL